MPGMSRAPTEQPGAAWGGFTGESRSNATGAELSLNGTLVFGKQQLDAAALRRRVNDRKVHLSLLPRGALVHFPEHPSAGFVADLLACHETQRCYQPHGVILRARNAPLPGYLVPTVDEASGQRRLILGSWQSVEDDTAAYARLFAGESGLRFALLKPTHVDLFLRDIYTPLVAGHELHVPEDHATPTDPALMRQWIHSHGIHVLHLSVSMARQLFDAETRLPSVRFVMLPRERLFWRDVQRIQAAIASDGQVYHLYGPPETTLTQLHFLARPEPGAMPDAPVPVGRPTGQSRAVVVKEGRPCDAMESGEILIRHAYPAHGYLRGVGDGSTLELQSPFIANPFRVDDPEPVYRTGDMGFIDADGALVCLGSASSLRRERSSPS
ncbi:AMP-binding enzyme [Roseateles sp. YR242]|nr:AMP-binding enzyme [Roseateles sp. YR242]